MVIGKEYLLLTLVVAVIGWLILNKSVKEKLHLEDVSFWEEDDEGEE